LNLCLADRIPQDQAVLWLMIQPPAACGHPEQIAQAVPAGVLSPVKYCGRKAGDAKIRTAIKTIV
jgi:hypothetical protein